MSDNCNKTDFPRLDAKGLEYYRWVSDIKIAFLGKGLLKTISDSSTAKGATRKKKASGTLTIDDSPTTDTQPSSEKESGPTVEQDAQALGYLRHHIDPSLKWEYMDLESPRELWATLKARFSDIKNVVLPALKAEWRDLRFVDFKNVADYNAKVLQLKARLSMCNVKISEEELLEKTLSTFPISAKDTARNYRWEIETDRITTFAQLINSIGVAESQDELLIQQNALRPIGTKRVPETNYGSASKKGKFKHNSSKGKGVLYGSNKWKRDAPREKLPGPPPGKPPAHARKVQSQVVGPTKPTGPRSNDRCARCGYSGHWFKQCRASKEVAAAYKAYRDLGPMQVNNVEVDDEDPHTNLNVKDFEPKTYDDPDIMEDA